MDNNTESSPTPSENQEAAALSEGNTSSSSNDNQPEETMGTLTPVSLPSNDNHDDISRESSKKSGLISKLIGKGKGSNSTDHVEGRYLIDFDNPITDYNSEFVKAYEVKDIKNKNNTEIYCIIYNKAISPRINVIKTLKSHKIPHFLTPIAADITFLSQGNEYRYAAVLPKPSGIRLREYITQSGPLSEDRITNLIVSPLTTILEELGKQDIVHGCINLDNVYINEAKQITLNECISKPTGYSQPLLYETIERGRALPIGKGYGTPSVDYYALGVLCLCLQRGRDLSLNVDNDKILVSKLMQGSFNTLIQNITLSSSMMDFYRGLLNDKGSVRWQYQSLKDWLKGKHFNLVRIPPLVEATRSIFFCEIQYFNRSSLAYAMQSNWIEARNFLKEDKLIKWIEGSVNNPEMADALRAIQKSISFSVAKNTAFDQYDELVVRSLAILEPGICIRTRDIYVNIDALGTFVAYEFMHKDTKRLQQLGTLFHKDLVHHNLNQENIDKRTLGRIEDLTELMQRSGLGFGMERFLYELNPTLPCQSPSMEEGYILTLDDILTFLEMQAKETGKYTIDLHVAGFIGSRIRLKNELLIKSLSRFPKIQTNKYVQVLTLLAYAQKFASNIKITEVIKIIGKQLVPIADNIHSKTIREEYAKNIKSMSSKGNIIEFYNYITDPHPLHKDQTGFEEAKKQYKLFSQQLAKLKKQKTIANLGYHYGLKVAMFLSYILCAVTLFILIAKS